MRPLDHGSPGQHGFGRQRISLRHLGAYRSSLHRPLGPLPRRRRRLRSTVPLFLIILALGLLAWTEQLESQVESPYPLSPVGRYSEVVARQGGPDIEVPDLQQIEVPQPLILRRGQTLGGLLGELGLEPADANAAVAALARQVDVRRIPAGESILAYYDSAARLSGLELSLTGKGRVELVRNAGVWHSSRHDFVRETRIVRIEGELNGVLEQAIRTAGGEPQVAYRMADVLQWDLDFNRDLRKGDRFEVLYEEVYLDGERVGAGGILALGYENRGQRFEAYRYGSSENDYYDADGRPLKKLFLRSPLPFTRITSGFSHRRFHPVLKVHRPHYGVDYGAPTGTPVRVTANGTVTFAARKGGSGNMVQVRHAGGILTAYLHLSRFAKGLRVGQSVRQGDVIGYVGATGLATAPHLDYRIQRDGRWIDPLSIKSVPAEPIPRSELPTFLAWREALRESLSTGVAPPEPPAVFTERFASRSLEPAAEAPSLAR